MYKMIKFFKKQKPPKTICTIEQQTSKHYMLEEAISLINTSIATNQETIKLLHKYNDVNKQEIQELKRNHKILTQTVRIFLMFFIMKS